jgi:hypothetical protein
MLQNITGAILQDKTLNPLLGAVMAEESERLLGYAERWRYYSGDQPDQLETIKGKNNDNLVENLCRVIVDRAVDFLVGKGVKIVVRGDEGKTKWLADWWVETRGDALLRTLGKDGAVCGHYYMKLMPASESGGEFPRVLALDPAEMTVIWDQEDIGKQLEYVLSYLVVQGGQILVKRQRHTLLGDGTWQIQDSVIIDPGTGTSLSPMVLFSLNEKWVVQRTVHWPHPWPAIVDGKNLDEPHEYYGAPDLTDDLMRLQDAINRNDSNIQRIIRFHAHPVTVLQGTRLRDAKLGPDKIIEIGQESKVYNVEMLSDLTSSSNFGKALTRAFWKAGRGTDPQAVEELSGDRVTNFRVEMLMHAALVKNDEKREQLGAALRALALRAMALGGQGAVRLRDIEIEWPDPLPVNETEERGLLVQDRAMGIVSKETVAEKVGYDWEQESQRIKAEQDAATPPQPAQAPQGATPPQADTKMPGNNPAQMMAGGARP